MAQKTVTEIRDELNRLANHCEMLAFCAQRIAQGCENKPAGYGLANALQDLGDRLAAMQDELSGAGA